ncbi:MAG: TonB-dependent receptor [Alphaproteobacteria bacterium]|nr:MAG: TonB-dependent receptor [Alphaproteobacteria bacterium]
MSLRRVTRRGHVRNWKKMAVSAVSVLALSGTAWAQQTPPSAAPANSPEGVQAFEPVFFARFAPVTALDMVRQLPGFRIDEGEDLRGFGATAGNVLIDGRRTSSKDSLSDELGRISARDVLRVELIRASAAGDIDVRGYTELANVVMKPASELKVSTTWAATTRWYEQGRIGAQIGGTRAWKTDNFGFRLAVQGTSLGEREEVDVTSANALGVVTSTQSEYYQQQVGELLITGAANWTPTARDTVNANFRILPRLFSNNAAAEVRLPSGTKVGDILLEYTEKDIWYVDAGGDWEHKFSPENAVKLIAVNRTVNWRPQQLLTQAVLGSPFGQVRDTSDNKAGEHVLRGVWTTRPAQEHTLEFGLEGAYNYREVDRQRQAGAIGGPYVPVAVPIATTKVEEERAEASITDVWRVNPALTLEGAINYEVSTISQTGDANQERDFTYAKPRLVATWTPTAQEQFRLSLSRDISQLDFADFATGLDSISNTANIGNPNLEPEQIWKASLQWKRQLGERGSISVTGFYDDIQDTQDFIASQLSSPAACITIVPTPAACYRTAVGNVGDGKRWGGRVEATLPLDTIGISNGILKLNVGAQDSEVIDPLTGEKRRISKQQEYDWSIDFRQDVPSMKFAWGGDYASAGAIPEYRHERIEIADPGEGDLDLFIETTALLGGALVRLTAENVFNQEREVDRRFYLPNRIPPGAFSSTEERISTYGATVTLTVAGAF